MSGAPLALREAGEGDLSAIAQVHHRAYDRSHFTSLLPAETLIAYYRYFLTDRAGIVLAEAPDGAGLSGFAVSGEGIPEGIARFKREHRHAILRAALAHPAQSARKAALQIVRRAGAAGVPPAPFLLLSIAAAVKGQGVGRVLLDAVHDRARRQGHDRIGLYVNSPNIGAINAYVAAGYRFTALLHDQYYMEARLA
jgi:ribosomal protein S18 acetylase RimI-like enzyme